MDPERWRAIEDLFYRAVDLPPDERSALLDGECAGDEDLRAQVERLVREDAHANSLLDPPGALLGAEAGDSRIGRRLGAFRLTRRIGAGGMGVVYAAERADGLFEQRVAVKLIRAGAATGDVQRRFERERRTLAALSHPNIARLLDGGTTEDGEPYLVMELVEGAPIDRHCDALRLSIERRLRLFADVCRAVHHAHTSLVIHRDLKPANVLVDAQGVPKLLDFGIARLLAPADDEQSEEELTRTLHRVLTPEYASPEQLAGGAITTATDVYSLGVVLYGLLTGRKPFRVDSGSPAAWERIVSERPPTRPSTAVLSSDEAGGVLARRAPAPEEFAASCGTTPGRLRNRLRGDLDRIVLMALRKEPERRYPSARALADDIERHLAGRPVVAREDSVLYRLSKFVRRNRIAVGAALLVASALVYGFLSARRGERLAALEAEHTRIEAQSFREIAEFLMAEFLSSVEHGDAAQREESMNRVRRQAEIVRRQHGGDVHLMANMLDALGLVGSRMDLFELAEELIREALQLRRDEFGREHLEVALSLRSLGELHFRRGEYGEAERLLGRALELHRAFPGRTHTDVATAANDHAVALRNLGEIDRAEALHREALALRRAQEPGSLSVAESLNNLAGIHLGRGEYEQAVELLDEALGIRAAIFGRDHRLTLQSVSNLANATWHVGRRERAREMFEEAAAGYRALRGDGREGLVVALSALASIELAEGALEPARAALDEACEIQRGRLGPDHPAIATLLVKLAELHQASGELEEARAQWLEALRIRRGMQPPSPFLLALTLRQFGLFLIDRGEHEKARRALEEALELLEQAPVRNEAELGRTELGLGICLRAVDRPEEAARHLRAALELMDGAPGIAEHERVLARRHLQSIEGTGE